MSGLVQDGPVYWPGFFTVRLVGDEVISMDEMRKSPDFSCDVQWILRFRKRVGETLPAIWDTTGPIYPAFKAMQAFFPFFERTAFAMFGRMAERVLWNPGQTGLAVMCAFGDFRFFCDAPEAANVMSKTPAWCPEIVMDLSGLLQYEVSRYNKFWLARMPSVRQDVLWNLCPDVAGLKARVHYLEEELRRRDEFPDRILAQPGSPLFSAPDIPDSPTGNLLDDIEKFLPDLGI